MISEHAKDLMRILISEAESFVSQNTNLAMRGITQHMLEKATLIIEELKSAAEKENLERFNYYILQLYRIIPRNTTEGFFEYESQRALERIGEEQMFLEAVKNARERILSKSQSDVFTAEEKVMRNNNLVVEDVDNSQVSFIKKMMGEDKNKFIRAWKVCNTNSEQAFQEYMKTNKIQSTSFLWHGSPVANFLSIVSNGLDLEHARYGMFGKGIYFAPKFGKSRGYTSVSGAFWRGQNKSYAMLGIFEVATGNTYSANHVCNGIPEGYDSLWARREAGLRNEEVVLYKNNCSSIRYLVQTT